MKLSITQLQEIMPHAGRRAVLFFDPLVRAMAADGIDTDVRAAAFLAQIAHESGELRYVRELASGKAYEGRKDLGNTQPGDGERFRGRGLIQITGRANYKAAGEALGVNFIENPALMELPIHAARVSTWFWKDRGLNIWADKGDFRRLTIRINGGLNGFEDRLEYWERAKRTLKVES
ncbi:MAG: glycoside hydrolase family 19 protein [Bradyrhizobium sp.]|uniref:glycoside hydrolase family 19 protein n=1 Tax=Bradyrhizobium sp. TaxID=376 RepID=UPI003D09A915